MLDASGNAMGAEGMEAVLELYRLETLNLADTGIDDMSLVSICKGPTVY